MPKHLLLNGTESWRLHDTTDLDQLRADLRAAMEDGQVTHAPVVIDGEEGSDRYLIINGTQVMTAMVMETEQQMGSFSGLAVTRARLNDR